MSRSQPEERERQRWLLLLALLLLPGLGLLCALLAAGWLRPGPGEGWLEVSLRPGRVADYSPDPAGFVVAAVSPRLIVEVLRDRAISAADLAARQATATAVLAAPIPTITPTPGRPGRPGLTPTPTATPSPTFAPPSATASPTPSQQPSATIVTPQGSTSTPTAVASRTPTAEHLPSSTPTRLPLPTLTSPPPAADLQLTMSDSPDPVAVGQTLTYSLTVHNNGPGSATAVTVTDALPLGVTYLSSSTSQGACKEALGTVTCSIGSLAPKRNASITIRVIPTIRGTLVNSASVTGLPADPSPGNNIVAVRTTVQ